MKLCLYHNSVKLLILVVCIVALTPIVFEDAFAVLPNGYNVDVSYDDEENKIFVFWGFPSNADRQLQDGNELCTYNLTITSTTNGSDETYYFDNNSMSTTNSTTFDSKLTFCTGVRLIDLNESLWINSDDFKMEMGFYEIIDENKLSSYTDSVFLSDGYYLNYLDKIIVEYSPISFVRTAICSDFTDFSDLVILSIDSTGTYKYILEYSDCVTDAVPAYSNFENFNSILDYEVISIDLTSVATVTPKVTENEKSGGGCADCTSPTFGKNSMDNNIVKDGFSWNYNYTDVMSRHVPNNLITTEVNATNTFTMKAYENNGVNNFRLFQIGFGLENIGDQTSEAEVILEIYLDEGKINEVIVYDDDENLMSFSTIHADVTECGYSTSSCIEITGNAVFREPLKNNVVVIQAIDKAGNSNRHFINHGINAVGESMNTPNTLYTNGKLFTELDKFSNIWIDVDNIQYEKNQYSSMVRITPYPSIVCDDPPISSVNVPTRDNCNYPDYKNLQAEIALITLTELMK